MPVFDREKAMVAVDGDTNLLRELLAMFRNEYPALLEKINQAVSAEDSAELRLHAHTLKGTLATLGAGDASMFALALETMARAQELAGTRQMYQRLSAAVKEFDRTATEYERTMV